MICPVCNADNLEGADQCANCGHDLRGFDQPDQPGGPDRGPAFIYRPLSGLAAQPPTVVSAGDPVGLAVRLMQNQQTDCVLVMDGDTLAGIITPWDILHKVARLHTDLNALTCADTMTPDPVCLRRDDDLAIALNKMADGDFRHIPLVEDDRPVGVVTIDDLYRALAPHLA